jgi:hypothetical protein
MVRSLAFYCLQDIMHWEIEFALERSRQCARVRIFRSAALTRLDAFVISGIYSRDIYIYLSIYVHPVDLLWWETVIKCT